LPLTSALLTLIFVSSFFYIYRAHWNRFIRKVGVSTFNKYQTSTEQKQMLALKKGSKEEK